MNESKGIPIVGRVTFIVHFIVSLVVGLPLLIVAVTAGAWYGYPTGQSELMPVFRAFGAIILLLGGGTSLYGITTNRWERMVYIVRCEMAYLAVQTIVFLVAALSDGGSVMGNWLFAAVSAVLFVLFLITHSVASK